MNLGNRSSYNSFIVLLLLLFLFPILPQYLYILEQINVVNFSLFILIFIYFITRRVLKIKRAFWEIPFFWIYMYYLCLLYFAQNSIVKGLSFVLSFLLLPYIIISEVDSEDKFLDVINALIYGGALLAIIGILEEILGFNYIQIMTDGNIGYLHEIRYGFLRIMATFGQPISYGLFQVFIIGLINYKLGTRIISKRKYYFIYALCAINIIFTVSRIAIIAFVLVQLWFSYKKSLNKFVKITTIIIILSLITNTCFLALDMEVPLIDDLIDTIVSTLGGSTSDSSFIGLGNRLDLYNWVIISMNKSFIFGKGISNTFSYALDAYSIKTSIENQYLNVLYHTGIVGLLLMICSYISVLVYASKNNKKKENKFLENEISFNGSIFIMLSVYYLMEFNVQETDLTRLYVVLISLLISYNKILLRKTEIS